jgi:hypothetical protein
MEAGLFELVEYSSLACEGIASCCAGREEPRVSKGPMGLRECHAEDLVCMMSAQVHSKIIKFVRAAALLAATVQDRAAPAVMFRWR